MLKFKINYELKNGDYDFFIIEGENIEEIKEKVTTELKKRNTIDAWSEELPIEKE